MIRRKKRTAEEKARRRARTDTHAELAQFLQVDQRRPVERIIAEQLAKVRPAYCDGPLMVDLPELITPAPLSKVAELRSPTWLKLVRMMPCACCGKGIPFVSALVIGGSQSEANHCPGRGRSGGGSDFETHPACGGPSGCHQQITDGKIEEASLVGHVARTQRAIFEQIRLGRLPAELLLAVALEVVLHHTER